MLRYSNLHTLNTVLSETNAARKQLNIHNHGRSEWRAAHARRTPRGCFGGESAYGGQRAGAEKGETGRQVVGVYNSAVQCVIQPTSTVPRRHRLLVSELPS